MSEERVECPYNSNHKIAPAKYIYHLMRCKDKLKVGHMFVHCEFNHLHVIKRENIVEHYEVCKDKVRQLEILKKLPAIRNPRLLRSQTQRDEREKIEAQLKHEFKVEKEEKVEGDTGIQKEQLKETGNSQERKCIKVERRVKQEGMVKMEKPEESISESQEIEDLGERVEYIFDCPSCGRILKDYLQGTDRNPEIDKLLRKFETLNRDLIKVQAHQAPK